MLSATAAAAALALVPASASAVGACPPDITPPTAHFTVSPEPVDTGSLTTLDASSSAGGFRTDYTYEAETRDCEVAASGPVAISSYEWEFGDGTTLTSSSPVVTHSFPPGKRTVTLTVRGTGIGSDSASHDVVSAWNVVLTKPAPTNFWKDNHKRQTIDLAATAGGPEPVQRIEFYVRGQKVGEDSTAPFSIPFDTTSVADGDAGVYAKAIGTGDTSGVSATRNVVIDNEAPAFTLVSAPSHAVASGDDTVTVRFTDNQLLYGNAICWADSPDPAPGSSYCVGAGVAKQYEGSYTFHLTGDGQHTVHFGVSDAAGNFGTGTAMVTIDGTPPDTFIDSGPADGSTSAGSSATFGLSSNEPASAYSCRLYPEASTAPAFEPCSGAASHTATGLTPGTYVFEASAVDVAGNRDQSAAKRTFTVAEPDPGTDPGTDPGGQQDPPPPPPPPPGNQGNGPGGSQQQPGQPSGPSGGGKPVKPGRCAALKGKKRARCIRRNCGTLNKRKGHKRYRKCVRAVTRKR
jgi:PKD repeat protein